MLTVVAKAPGFRDETREVPLDQDADIVITLSKLPPTEPGNGEEADAEDSNEEAATPHPKPHRVYRPKPAAKPASQPAKPKPNCDPPYYIDGRGVKRYKSECF